MDLADRVTQNLAMSNGEDKEDDLRRHAVDWIEGTRASSKAGSTKRERQQSKATGDPGNVDVAGIAFASCYPGTVPPVGGSCCRVLRSIDRSPGRLNVLVALHGAERGCGEADAYYLKQRFECLPAWL